MTREIEQNLVAALVPVAVVDRLEIVDVDDGDAAPHMLVFGTVGDEFSQPPHCVATVGHTGQLVDLGRPKREIAVLPELALPRMDGGDIDGNAKHIAVGIHRLRHPQPAAVMQVGFHGTKRHFAAPVSRRGDPGVDVVGFQDGPLAGCVVPAHDLRPGRALVWTDVIGRAKCRVGKSQSIVLIVERDQYGCFAL
ncbi:hypothetical protein D9M72_499260 [compost metagenome]